MDAVTILAWILRILPFLLFWWYLKAQAKDGAAAETGVVIAKETLLKHRSAEVATEAPAEVRMVRMAGKAELPAFLSDQSGLRERKAPKARNARRDGDASQKNNGSGGVAARVQGQEEHLESLVNYLAFSPKEQKEQKGASPSRNGHPNGGSVRLSFDRRDFSAETSELANKEAQKVLTAAIQYKRVGVAKDMYTQLTESQIAISAQTYRKMVEACVAHGDIREAGDFLHKMDAAGHPLDPDLIDKVMEFYGQPEDSRPVTSATAEVRKPAADTTLSADAPAFMPAAVQTVLEPNTEALAAPQMAQAQFWPAQENVVQGLFNLDAYSDGEDSEDD